MKAAILFLAALCAFTLPTNARIGETLEQCIERYGQPTGRMPKPDEPAYFLKDGISIAVDFYQGKAKSILFQKKEIGGMTVDLSDEEIAALMSANSNGAKWRKFGEFSDAWETEDKRLIATHTKIAGCLSIQLQGDTRPESGPLKGF